jgi:hypothetical protein
MKLRKFIATTIREYLNENIDKSKTITELVNHLTKKYVEEYGVSCDLINQGDCENFADELYTLGKDYGIEGEILSDGLFFDPFGDEEPEMMWDISEYGNKPNDFETIGLPSHYWFYYNGKHYDSDAPQGVSDVFQLPIIRDFYIKKRALGKK